MKLFVFKPDCFGPMNYSVMADNEEMAIEYVKAHYVKENGETDHTGWGEIDSKDPEDGGKVYSIEAYDIGQVSETDNS